MHDAICPITVRAWYRFGNKGNISASPAGRPAQAADFRSPVCFKLSAKERLRIETMRIPLRTIITAVNVAIIGVILLTGRNSAAQDGDKLPKSIHIQGQAMGQSTQLGQTFSLNVIIEEFSTADDQKALAGAFNEKQNEGLVNALTKMKSKGRMSITGTLGYDVNYIRKFSMPDGSTKYRLVTDRPITFGEAWSDSRSMDYNLSGIEIIITADGKKNSGTLAPACKLKMDKEGQLQLELLQNEWKLVDVRKR
jgi:hypothetical protein